MRRLLLIAAAGALHAQTPAVDSAARLNRAGLSIEAAQYARRAASQSAVPDEQCQLRVEMLTALDRLGAFSVIGSELAYADSTCGDNAEYRRRAPEVERIRKNAVLPPLPKSGFDFSAVDRFNELAEVLSADREPTDAQWRAYYETPGYRFADRPDLRSNMEIAFRPSLSAQRDSLLAKGGAPAFAVRYLRDGFARRAASQQWRDTASLQAAAERARKRALAFLPKGMDPPIPFVAFAVFTPDGYSRGPEGVLLDLPFASRMDIEDFLAHEFHHSLNAPISKLNRMPGSQAPEASLLNALVSLRNEGIADLIDKPYPVHHPDSTYERSYNEYYARTPEVLRMVDSLIATVADDSTRMRTVGQMVNRLLIYGSHPTGAYMAREIQETFGVDSLLPATIDAFSMFRTYAAAEARHGRAAPFSAKTVAVLDAIEKKHLRP